MHGGVFTTRRPQESNSFKLAAIVNVDGLKIQLLAMEHPVPKVISRLKERPNGVDIVYSTPRYIYERSTNRVVSQDQHMRTEVPNTDHYDL